VPGLPLIPQANQVKGLWVEDSKITMGAWNALDYVAVQYGHICRSTVSQSAWCLYVKGATEAERPRRRKAAPSAAAGTGAARRRNTLASASLPAPFNAPRPATPRRPLKPKRSRAGGSSYILIDSNLVSDCGEAGLRVGQGTGVYCS
jgi:hypothetical protein